MLILAENRFGPAENHFGPIAGAVGGDTLRELVELIARGLVDHPEQVIVREVHHERGLTFELSVAPDDMGKVIGKGGRIVKAMRVVVSAAAVQENQRVSIEIV
jgi:predicted RNA-binding protein YlqC (UPF0109 family)